MGKKRNKRPKQPVVTTTLDNLVRKLTAPTPTGKYTAEMIEVEDGYRLPQGTIIPKDYTMNMGDIVMYQPDIWGGKTILSDEDGMIEVRLDFPLFRTPKQKLEWVCEAFRNMRWAENGKPMHINYYTQYLGRKMPTL